MNPKHERLAGFIAACVIIFVIIFVIPWMYP